MFQNRTIDVLSRDADERLLWPPPRTNGVESREGRLRARGIRLAMCYKPSINLVVSVLANFEDDRGLMVHAHAHVESGKLHDSVREGIQKSENGIES